MARCFSWRLRTLVHGIFLKNRPIVYTQEINTVIWLGSHEWLVYRLTFKLNDSSVSRSFDKEIPDAVEMTTTWMALKTTIFSNRHELARNFPVCAVFCIQHPYIRAQEWDACIGGPESMFYGENQRKSHQHTRTHLLKNAYVLWFQAHSQRWERRVRHASYERDSAKLRRQQHHANNVQNGEPNASPYAVYNNIVCISNRKKVWGIRQCAALCSIQLQQTKLAFKSKWTATST